MQPFSIDDDEDVPLEPRVSRSRSKPKSRTVPDPKPKQSRTVPDPKPNAKTVKFVVIAMIVMIVITTLYLSYPHIVRIATYSQGFLKGMLKEYRMYKKTAGRKNSWLSFACSVSKPISIPVVAYRFFKQVTDQKISLIFPLLMVLPTYCADIATMIMLLTFCRRIVSWNKSFLCHAMICLSMWELPIQNIWPVLAQAVLSCWYLNREDESSGESYASMIALCLEHAWSSVRKTVGSWDMEDFAWFLRKQMGLGKRPIVLNDRTKTLGYRRRGEGRGQEQSLGPRGRSPCRRP
jgi:hypothetical protein